MDPKQAQTVTTVVMLTFLLVGGFYVKDVPVWIGWIKYFSFIYWGGSCNGGDPLDKYLMSTVQHVGLWNSM